VKFSCHSLDLLVFSVPMTGRGPLKAELALPPASPHPSQEYEERLARLKADYEAEQESRARLEEDITAMRNLYDVKLSTLEESLRKETGAHDLGCLPPF
jgi:hypothetical protein